MSKRRRVPRHILARLRSEGKLTTRSERTFQAEQSLRDLMATRGHIPPAAMRSAYRRGVSVSTLVEISGRTENQVKESIVKAGENMSENQTSPDNREGDGWPGAAEQGERPASVPVDPPSTDEAATEQGGAENGAEDAPEGIGNLSDGELVQRASALRQAGNEDAAAHYDREIEERAERSE